MHRHSRIPHELLVSYAVLVVHAAPGKHVSCWLCDHVEGVSLSLYRLWQVLRGPGGFVILLEPEWEFLQPLVHPLDILRCSLLGHGALDDGEAILLEIILPCGWRYSGRHLGKQLRV